MSSGRPAPTRKCCWPSASIDVRRSVESSRPPVGVAPPVTDDCAPIGSTCVARHDEAGDFALGARLRDPIRATAGKVRRVFKMPGDGIGRAVDGCGDRSIVGSASDGDVRHKHCIDPSPY